MGSMEWFRVIKEWKGFDDAFSDGVKIAQWNGKQWRQARVSLSTCKIHEEHKYDLKFSFRMTIAYL